MKPGQYVDCYSIGPHQNKPDHKALIQVGKITVIRDKDLDGIAGNSGTEDTGLFGVNIHGAQKTGATKTVGPWSAGCNVFSTWKHKEELISVCEKFRVYTANKFTYTLITEKQLIS